MKIPETWQYISIKDCCDVVSGSTPKRNKPEYWNGSIDWVTPKDLSKLDSPIAILGLVRYVKRWRE